MYVYEDEEDVDQTEYVFSKVRHNRIELVRTALEQGFDPFSIDDKGNTMLHICCQNNHRKLASVVLKAGCPTGEINYKGLTPLSFCKLYQFKELTAWLNKKINQEDQQYTQYNQNNQNNPDENAEYDDDNSTVYSNNSNSNVNTNTTYSSRNSSVGQLNGYNHVNNNNNTNNANNTTSNVPKAYDARFSMR